MQYGVGLVEIMRRLGTVLATVFLAAMLAASFLGGSSYSAQHREFIDAPPSVRFPLGTDDLGRDRMVRLLHATRISLLFAGAAALGATLVAALLGGIAGYAGGWFDRLLVRAIDLLLALPSLFLLLAARAMMPLNASPISTLLVTYALMSLMGWLSPARVIRAGVRSSRDSEYVLQARAEGCPETRILLRHILPNLRPIMVAQFWTSIPVFILTEASLGFLGLSASEPFPTWGSLMRELQNPLLAPVEAFAPIAAIALSVSCFKLISPWRGSQA
jgi:ABC-type dipeptide/oligopeptide/nickel transport system permease subunit